jgi:hypothetical protein
VKKIDDFLANFSSDPSPDKRLDFISWHEYGQSFRGTACGGPGCRACWPSTISEGEADVCDRARPVHGKLGTHENNRVNAAGLVKSQYFASVYSPA